MAGSNIKKKKKTFALTIVFLNPDASCKWDLYEIQKSYKTSLGFGPSLDHNFNNYTTAGAKKVENQRARAVLEGRSFKRTPKSLYTSLERRTLNWVVDFEYLNLKKKKFKYSNQYF